MAWRVTIKELAQRQHRMREPVYAKKAEPNRRHHDWQNLENRGSLP
jgi:hypothetical protein